MQAVSLTTNQRRESIFKKMEQIEWKRRSDTEVQCLTRTFSWWLKVLFPEVPIIGRNHSYTGVHTYTSQGVCLCDSYTVIILDG